MYPKNNKHHTQIFSIFEELKPRHKSSKKFPSFPGKIHPFFQTKIKASPKKTLNCSTSLIRVDNDKSIFEKGGGLNYRNKKSNFLIFQRSFQQNKKKQIQNNSINVLSSSFKPQKSTNSSFVFSPFSSTQKVRKITKDEEEIKQDSYFESTTDNFSLNIDKIIKELNNKLSKCKEIDLNKLTDARFEIIKHSLICYSNLVKGDKEKKYLIKIIDLLSSIFKFKNDQISELTTNNSSFDNHLFNFNKKNSSLKDSTNNSRKIIRLSHKNSLDVDQKNLVGDKNSNSSESDEELESIQFCDKIRMEKTNSMPNLNLPKLDLHFEKNSPSNKTRNNVVFINGQKNKKPQKPTYSSLAGMRKILNYKNL